MWPCIPLFRSRRFAPPPHSLRQSQQARVLKFASVVLPRRPQLMLTLRHHTKLRGSLSSALWFNLVSVCFYWDFILFRFKALRLRWSWQVLACALLHIKKTKSVDRAVEHSPLLHAERISNLFRIEHVTKLRTRGGAGDEGGTKYQVVWHWRLWGFFWTEEVRRRCHMKFKMPSHVTLTVMDYDRLPVDIDRCCASVYWWH